MFSRNLKFKAIWSTLLVLTLLLTPFSVLAQGPAPLAPLITPDGAEIIPGQYIVVFKSDYLVASAEGAIQAEVAALGGKVNFMYGAALNGYSATLSAAGLKAVRSNPSVAYVAADAIIKLDDPEPDDMSSDVTQLSPTWGLNRIDQRSLPLNTSYVYFKTGAGVHAYILDTGIRSTHTQFGTRATKDYDAIGGGPYGNDCNGHGTHVAGTIGGTKYGVAKAVRLHAVRVLDCGGSGAYSQVIAGVNWVRLNRIRPAVANMSLGGSAYTPLDSALNSMIASGVVLVVAAGNSSANACLYSPARVPQAITVGATTSTDARASYSNYGTCLDIFAPGSSITSAWYTSNTAINTISGTSMASPHVAGVAALYLQGHPTASNAAVRNYLVAISTLNKVIGPAGSPNRLLYSRFPGN